MNKMISIIAGSVLVGSLAVAAGKRADKTQGDHAAHGNGKEVHEVDTTKNPITGSTTTTETYKNQMDSKTGKANIEVKDKTKQTKDGKVSKETDIEAESTSK